LADPGVELTVALGLAFAVMNCLVGVSTGRRPEHLADEKLGMREGCHRIIRLEQRKPSPELTNLHMTKKGAKLRLRTALRLLQAANRAPTVYLAAL
jgi:hypothetical protein